LLVRVCQRALVQSPDWESLESMFGDDVRLVALDLHEPKFVSSLFWEGCIELGRRLAQTGRQLVLVYLDDRQKRLLELVAGGARLPVLDSEEDLEERLRSASVDRPSAEGVTTEEKNMLWS